MPTTRACRPQDPHGKALGWVPQGVWWHWRVPREGELLDPMAEDRAVLRHGVQESLRRAADLWVEARRPQIFWDFGVWWGPLTAGWGSRASTGRLSSPSCRAHRGYMDCI